MISYNSTLRDWVLHHQGSVLGSLKWMGVPVLKNPIDLAMYWEIIWECKPDTIIEIGSKYGGSALFFACLLDTFCGGGCVVSIDIDHSDFRAQYPTISCLTGDSGSAEIAQRALGMCSGNVMVVHDGDHSPEQVYKDLCLYAPMVSVGQYLVVEDTIIDEFRPGDSIGMAGGGPRVAVAKFRNTHPNFVPDASKERYFLTYNRGGWLKRVG